ncbi:Fruit-specific protein [Capsicum chinense]|nr:Fruit-specific protein [Capsicum chinense]
MAAKNSMIKFVLLTTTTVDKCGTSSKFQVMALRDLLYEATLLQNKLLLNDVLGSCDSYCSSNSDCGGFTLCQWCWEKTNPFTGAIYSTCSILP